MDKGPSKDGRALQISPRAGERSHSILIAILIAIVAGFVVAATILTFGILLGTEAGGYRAEFFGAFVGAFFAFLFIRLAEGLNSLRDRSQKHYNALVRIKYLLVENIDLIGINEFVLKGRERDYKQAKEAGETLVDHTKLVHLTVMKDVLLDLADVEFANSMFKHLGDLLRLNHTMDTLQAAYDSIAARCAVPGKPKALFFKNMDAHWDMVSKLNRHLSRSEEDAIRLYAEAIILWRDAPWLTLALRKLVRSKGSLKGSEKLEDEIRRVPARLASATEASEERNQSIETDSTPEAE